MKGTPRFLKVRNLFTAQYNKFFSGSNKKSLSQPCSHFQKHDTKVFSLADFSITNQQYRAVHFSQRDNQSKRNNKHKSDTTRRLTAARRAAIFLSGGALFWLWDQSGSLKCASIKPAVKKVKSVVIETSNFDTILPHLSKCNEDSLVMFDVDLTLLAPKDAILHDKNYMIVTRVFQDFENRFGKEHMIKLWSILLSQRQPRLVDTAIPKAINELIKKGIKVVALTQCSTRRQGIIDSKETWRFNELSSLGINFSESFPGHPALINLGTPLPDETNYPLYKSGIIFSGNVNKPKALEAFFHQLNYFPKQIIFIDDCLEYLQSIQKFCKANDIDFLGFHYTAIQSENTPPIHEARIELQFKTLEEKLRWLSDQEADSILDISKRKPKC